MAVRRPENAAEAPPDVPRRDGLDQFAIYVVKPEAAASTRRRVYETSLSGIGRGIEMLYEEDEIPRGWRVGVLDRNTRAWLVNPFV